MEKDGKTTEKWHSYIPFSIQMWNSRQRHKKVETGERED